jgi:phage terminase small subunit
MSRKPPKAKDDIDDLAITEKNKIFCREYILDWNATRSYLVAYPDVKDSKVATAAASRLLTNVNIQAYIEEIQKDLEKMAGISRLKVISEHMKLAFSSIAHLHNTWIKRKDFEELTEDQKACIAEIDTKIKTEWEYDADEKQKTPINVEYVRVKLYDKQKALDSISKMLGYDSPIKIDANINNNQITKVIYE